MKVISKILLLLVLVSSISNVQAQIGFTGDKTINYLTPSKYEIGGIKISGTKFLDKNGLTILSGLAVGDKIDVPGERITGAIKNLWKQKLFKDISIDVVKFQGNMVFLEIHVVEQPRLSKFRFTGVTKGEADDIREKIRLYREKIVTENLLATTENVINEFYVDKGFLNVETDLVQKPDSLQANHVVLTINVKKHKKVKINKIRISGNDALSDAQIRRTLSETKERAVMKPFRNFDSLLFVTCKNILTLKFDRLVPDVEDHLYKNFKLRIFKSSKFLEENLRADKAELIAKYNQMGYRDAKIVTDSIYASSENGIDVALSVDEGNKYYFRNITWVGNTVHSTDSLNQILGIDKGDVYNQALLEKRLFMNPSGFDVSSWYMDAGYLFFNLNPVEVLVENDSIDIELRIREGKQARINKVTVVGNTKTNDHVIMREIRTKPGMLFSRSDIIRTNRELAQLGYFDPEKLNVIPKPNPADGTVDIEYVVEERSSDQIEVSGGWGGGRVVGTVGISFNNFSTRNFFKKNAWRPLPAGDGQRLSIRAQSNGVYYQSYNASFTEPWLGGKKPNSLSVTVYHSRQSNGLSNTTDADGNEIPNPDAQNINITGLSVGLGKRLKWPDDFFILYREISFQNYSMDNWRSFIFSDGQSKNLFLKYNLTRSSVNKPIYPTAGSKFVASVQATPPYSAFYKGETPLAELPAQDRYEWIEYHKWKFTSSWFTSLAKNLVLNTRVGFGYLGNYNSDLGAAPFERFYLGGSGLTGFSLDGREIIALRGYDDQSVTPRRNGNAIGGTMISKYTMEMRFPFSLNPSATIYGLAFAEAGNTWDEFNEFNPFAVKRSAGVGIRIFLPMFGLLGLDWGYRFDDVQNIPGMQRSQIHFTIGANLGEL